MNYVRNDVKYQTIKLALIDYNENEISVSPNVIKLDYNTFSKKFLTVQIFRVEKYITFNGSRNLMFNESRDLL